MADHLDSQTRRRVMQQIRKTDTKPELIVRRLLHGLGFRFRLHRNDLPGTPDIVLPKHRTVIMVNGCFWHQHSCPLGKKPKSNLSYWLPKLRRNMVRDATNQKTLLEQGWNVVTIWECETEDIDALEFRLLRGIGSMV